MALRGALHLDAALTDLSIEFSQSLDDLIGLKIAPPVPVGKQSDKYYVFDYESFRIPEDALSSKGFANIIERKKSDDTYYCDGHGLRDIIADVDLQSADTQLFEMEVESMELITTYLRIKHEQAVATAMLTAANYPSGNTKVTLTGEDRWGGTTDNPIDDIKSLIVDVHRKCGKRPNTLIFTEDVWQVMGDLSEFTDRFKYTSGGSISKEMFANFFEIENIYVPRSLYQSAAKNETETVSLTPLWSSDYVVAMYVPPRPGKRVPSTLYSFLWNLKGTRNGMQFGKYREEGRGGVLGSSVVEGNWWYDLKKVGVYTGSTFVSAGILIDVLP